MSNFTDIVMLYEHASQGYDRAFAIYNPTIADYESGLTMVTRYAYDEAKKDFAVYQQAYGAAFRLYWDTVNQPEEA